MATAAQIATIATELANRYSSQILVEVTNPQLASATTLNTTRRDNAVQDADSYFRMSGITLDTANIMHVAVIVEGAFTRLQVIAGQLPLEAWSDWKRTVRDLALVTSRNRLTPSTNSNLNPTSEEANSLPAGDLTRWKRLRGSGPGGGGPKFD